MVLPESVGGGDGRHSSEKGSHNGAAGVSWLMADVFVGTGSLLPHRLLLLLSSKPHPLQFQVSDPWRSYLLVSLLSLMDEQALPPRLVFSCWVCTTVRVCNVLSWIPPLPGKGFQFLQRKDNSSPNAPPSLFSEKVLHASVREEGTAWLTLSLGISGSRCHRKIHFHAKGSGPPFPAPTQA